MKTLSIVLLFLFPGTLLAQSSAELIAIEAVATQIALRIVDEGKEVTVSRDITSAPEAPVIRVRIEDDTVTKAQEERLPQTYSTKAYQATTSTPQEAACNSVTSTPLCGQGNYVQSAPMCGQVAPLAAPMCGQSTPSSYVQSGAMCGATTGPMRGFFRRILGR
jgi:hypothetical protein